MPTKNAGVDKYIAKAGEFARPILTQFRQIVHAACPEVEESLKWGAPSFTYRGMLCQMAAFKAHCAFRFWKHDLIVKTLGKDGAALEACKHIESAADLPSKKVLTACIKTAMLLNDEGVKVERPKKEKGELVVPDDVVAALKKNKTAQATFEGFSPSHRREYVEWITEAKTEETRQRRIAQAVEMMTEGKSRHWKYAKC